MMDDLCIERHTNSHVLLHTKASSLNQINEHTHTHTHILSWTVDSYELLENQYYTLSSIQTSMSHFCPLVIGKDVIVLEE